MRTTVTLDPDTEQVVRQRMEEQRISFKQALNDVIRAGAQAAAGESEAFRTPTASLGRPAVDLDQALRIAGNLEDDDLLAKLRRGA